MGQHALYLERRDPVGGSEATVLHEREEGADSDLIGGDGEQKTFRLIARYADACNLFARMGDDVLRKKLDVLRGHCEALGRP